jgi:hypothetical protein
VGLWEIRFIQTLTTRYREGSIMSQATLQQIKKVSQLGGSALVREFGKLAKLDKRFDLDSDVEIKDQLMSVISELESDFAIDNQDNNETVNNQAKDQALEVTPASDNEPIGTGLAGSSGELYYWPVTDDYACKPYSALTAISSSVFDLVKSNFQPLANVKKQVLAKQQKAVEVKPIKYHAQFVFSYTFESIEDLNGLHFTNLGELESFLGDKGVEYGCIKSEDVMIKRLQGQRSVGTTGNTKGGLSDPFKRLDPSVPVESDRIKAVKKGSSAHLALLALMDGINIKDKSETAIASLQSLADSNNCEMINPEQFSWKFRQASLMNGYGYELTAPNTYKLVMPEGLDTIKVK